MTPKTRKHQMEPLDHAYHIKHFGGNCKRPAGACNPYSCHYKDTVDKPCTTANLLDYANAVLHRKYAMEEVM